MAGRTAGDAPKVMHHRRALQPEAFAQFEDEARAVAALSHPSIVASHDFAIEDGTPYTVSELLDGESLRARVRATRRLDHCGRQRAPSAPRRA